VCHEADAINKSFKFAEETKFKIVVGNEPSVQFISQCTKQLKLDGHGGLVLGLVLELD